MNIKIIAVGKIKEKYMMEGIKEYSKRLSKYSNVKIIEVTDEKTSEKLSEREINLIKDKEGARILSKIPQNAYIISLDIKGKQLSSEDLAEKIENLMVNGVNNIVFIIGGSLGLADEILEKSNFRLSFSKMTFPHQMMRLILLEQVYRGFRIMRGEPYHK